MKASQEKDNHLYCLTRCAQNSWTLSPCNSDVVADAVTGAGAAVVAVAAVGDVTFIAVDHRLSIIICRRSVAMRAHAMHGMG